MHQECTDRISGERVIRPHQLAIAGYSLGSAGLEKSFVEPVTLTGESAEVPDAVPPPAPPAGPATGPAAGYTR